MILEDFNKALPVILNELVEELNQFGIPNDAVTWIKEMTEYTVQGGTSQFESMFLSPKVK